jgi:hypothetical protein
MQEMEVQNCRLHHVFEWNCKVQAEEKACKRLATGAALATKKPTQGRLFECGGGALRP